MATAYIYGAGQLVSNIISKAERDYRILGLLDANEKKWGNTIDGYTVLGNIEYLHDKEYDKIILSQLSYKTVRQFLIDKGIPKDKIVTEYTTLFNDAREYFIRDLAIVLKTKGLDNFSVAEGGVYKGEFSKIISESFPESPLYLFDTFEGFDEGDMIIDEQKGLSKANINNVFKDTSVEMVLKQLLHPERVVICKGYFPDTTKMVPEQHYGFVMLDFDLYKPILDGLRYFYPRMVKGGIILCHEYFSNTFTGVKKAIEKFTEENNGHLTFFPIGDHVSIIVLKDE